MTLCLESVSWVEKLVDMCGVLANLVVDILGIVVPRSMAGLYMIGDVAVHAVRGQVLDSKGDLAKALGNDPVECAKTLLEAAENLKCCTQVKEEVMTQGDLAYIRAFEECVHHL